MDSVEIVLDFMNRINRRDADKLAELMAEDHVFIDSQGRSVRGREKMRAAWRAYYAFCPGFARGEPLKPESRGVFGTAGGTIASNGELPPQNRWRTPAAWLATVENGLLKEWRVYADNKPVYEIMARSESVPARQEPA